MNTTRLKQVRQLFNTGDRYMDYRNRLEWVRAVRLVRSTKRGWLLDIKKDEKQ